MSTSSDWSGKKKKKTGSSKHADHHVQTPGSRPDLDREVDLGRTLVAGGLAALAGRVHRVAAATVPRHGHVTVVGEPGDPLAAQRGEDGVRLSPGLWRHLVVGGVPDYLGLPPVVLSELLQGVNGEGPDGFVGGESRRGRQLHKVPSKRKREGVGAEASGVATLRRQLTGCGCT